MTPSESTKWRAIPLPWVIFALTLLVIALLFSLQPSPETKPQADLVPLVDTMPIEIDRYQPTITLYGRIESPREAALSATIEAYVAEVPAQEGMTVQQGDLLVQLEEQDARLLYHQRQAELDNINAQIASEQTRHKINQAALAVEEEILNLSRKGEERYEKLRSQNMASDLNRDEAQQKTQAQKLSLLNRRYEVENHPHRLKQLQAQAQKLTAQRDQAALDLERATIRAPFPGRITGVSVAPGDRARPGVTLVTLYDLEHVQVRAQIPSRYIPPVQSALAENVTLTAEMIINEQPVHLLLKRLAGAVDPGQGGVDGLFVVEGHNLPLTLGTTGAINLQLPTLDHTFIVPPTALYGQDRIYRVSDQRLHTVHVQRLGEVQQPNGERWPLLRADIPDQQAILVTQLANAVGGLTVKVATSASQLK